MGHLHSSFLLAALAVLLAVVVLPSHAVTAQLTALLDAREASLRTYAEEVSKEYGRVVLSNEAAELSCEYDNDCYPPYWRAYFNQSR